MDSQRSAPPTLEHLSRTRARALLLPHIMSHAASVPPSDQPIEVVVIVNAPTGSLMMIGRSGSVDLEAIFRGKEGRVPASKESIDAMPVVKVEEKGLECSICLSEFAIGEEAKQMPCNHKYHAGCIDKWLGIQGSCPVCRHQMPVEGAKEGGDGGNSGDEAAGEESPSEGGEEDGEEGRGDGGRWDLERIPSFLIHIYFAGRERPRTNPDPEPRESDESDDSDDSEEDNSDPDGSSTEDMDVDDGSDSDEMDVDNDENTTS